MGKFRLPIYLNIRQKIIVGLSICILAVGCIGFLSHHYLRKIEKKVHFVQIADDLKNTILEIRRYEKNYFLYGLPEDIEENSNYIKEALDTVKKIAPELKGLRGATYLHTLEEKLLLYQKYMKELVRYHGTGNKKIIHALEEDIRNTGKELVELSEALMNFERKEILSITKLLRTQLLSGLVLLLVIGIFLVPFVAKKIIRPLQVIEKTTLRIARGNFRPLPVYDTRDETQRVVEAFNRMVKELEKRQDQLVQAKKLSSLGTLTSGVAHQLNNPLNNISTSCQILFEEVDQANLDFVKKMLGNIQQEVNRARDIVKGLLEFSREKEFSLKPTHLAEVVERSIRLISSQVPAGIEIITDIPKDLILDLDAQHIQEALLNLLINATQAIESPPGEISIKARKDVVKNQVVITVEDTGAGIPEEHLSNIFDPFFTTKEVGAGTGLGLSIVYGIIQKHNGSISVQSKRGEGTRFTIRLPIKKDS